LLSPNDVSAVGDMLRYLGAGCLLPNKVSDNNITTTIRKCHSRLLSCSKMYTQNGALSNQ